MFPLHHWLYKTDFLSNVEELSNLIMAWYYCGYYTGIYQVN